LAVPRPAGEPARIEDLPLDDLREAEQPNPARLLATPSQISIAAS